jgi:hypothetical protein
MKFLIYVAAIVLLGSVEARAGSASNVTITRIEAEAQGHFFVYLSSAVQGSPSCASSQPGFVVDGTTAGGRVVITLIEEAYAMGKTLTISGNNLCDVHAGYETLWDIYTTN